MEGVGEKNRWSRLMREKKEGESEREKLGVIPLCLASQPPLTCSCQMNLPAKYHLITPTTPCWRTIYHGTDTTDAVLQHRNNMWYGEPRNPSSKHQQKTKQQYKK